MPAVRALGELAPAEGVRAFQDALAQPVAGEWNAALDRLGVYNRVRRGRPLAGLPFYSDVILEPEVERVHADGLRRAVGNHLQREVSLRSAERAIRPAGRRVGIGEPAVVARVGAAVEIQRPLPRAPNDAGPGRQISARVHDGFGVNGGDFAVAPDAHPNGRGRAVPPPAGDEFLMARRLYHDGLSRAARENGGENGQPRFVLAAVPRAHADADYADILARDAEREREQQPVLMHAARGFPHRKPFAVPIRDRRARLQRRARMGRRGEGVFDDEVRAREAVAHAAAFKRNRLPAREIAAIVDTRGVRPQSVLGARNERQRLIARLYERQRVFGGVFIIGGDCGDFIAHEPRLSIQNGNIRRDPSGRAIERRNRRPNARRLQRVGHVHRQNPRVRMRAAKNFADEHTRQANIGGEPRLADKLLCEIAAQRGLAHGGQGGGGVRIGAHIVGDYSALGGGCGGRFSALAPDSGAAEHPQANQRDCLEELPKFWGLYRKINGRD